MAEPSDTSSLAVEGTAAFHIDPLALSEILKGTSIVSLSVADTFIELGLTEQLTLKIQADGSRIAATLLSTLNESDIPPQRIKIIMDNEMPEARLVAHRIGVLRRLHGLAFNLTEAMPDQRMRIERIGHAIIEATGERGGDVTRHISRVEFAIERLMPIGKDALYVEAASSGSFWITVITKSRAAYEALLNIAPAFYEEGRDALLQRVRAQTNLKQLEVEQKRNDVQLRKIGGLIDLGRKVGKIEDDEVKKAILAVFVNNLKELGHDSTLLLEVSNSLER